MIASVSYKRSRHIQFCTVLFKTQPRPSRSIDQRLGTTNVSTIAATPSGSSNRCAAERILNVLLTFGEKVLSFSADVSIIWILSSTMFGGSLLQIAPRSSRSYLNSSPNLHGAKIACAACSTRRMQIWHRSIGQRLRSPCDLLHDLLSSPISHRCVWSGLTGHNLTPEKRDNNYTHHPLTPTSCLRNKATYNWHLSLFWVSVTYTLTRSSSTVSRVSATFYYHFTFQV